MPDTSMGGDFYLMFKKWVAILSASALLVTVTPTVVRAETLSYAIEPQYESATPFVDGFASVRKDGKWGAIDKQGRVVVPFQYDFVETFLDGVAVVRAAGLNQPKYGVVSETGAKITPVTYDYAIAVGAGYARVALLGPSGDVWAADARWGMVGPRGEIVPPIYEELDNLADGMFKAKKGGKYGYLDANGKAVTAFVYDDAEAFSDGRGLVRQNGTTGFVDRTGKLVIPFTKKGDHYGKFSEGMAFVAVDGKYGYVDTFGTMVIAPQYDEAWIFDQGLAPVARGGKHGYVDRTGQEVVPLKYDEVSNAFKNGLARVAVGEDYILEPSESGDIYFGLPGNRDYRVLSTKKFGFVNTHGDEVIPLQYDYAEEFKDGFAKVAQGGSGAGAYQRGAKFGYIDTTGQAVVPPRYDFLGGDIFDQFSGFTEGLLAVSNGGTGDVDEYTGGKWGYVDGSGREVVPLIYDHASPFRGGLGRVVKDGKYGFVDASGKEVVPCIYDEVGDFSSGMAEVARGGKGGYVDAQGREVTPLKYRFLKPFLQGTAAVKEDGAFGKVGFLQSPLPSVAPVSLDIASPGSGQPATVTLASATPGVTIYYTTNGKDPNTRFGEADTYQYTGAFTLWKSTTIKAVGVAKGLQDTPVARRDYKQAYLPGKPGTAPKADPQPADPGAAARPGGFVDVDPTYWARHSIQWAVDKKIVSYGSGTFRPKAMVTEPEFLTMLLRAHPELKVPAPAGGGAPWYEPYYKLAEELGWPLLHEADGEHFNRGQAARLVAASQGFAFSNVKDAVEFVLDHSLMGGKTAMSVDGFAPDAGLTRAEAITLIHNMKERGVGLVKVESKPDPAESKPGQSTPEFVVRGISIGDPEEKVLDLLGQPARKDLSEYGFYWSIYNQDYDQYVQVGIENGRVVALYTSADVWSSGRGLRAGMALKDVEAKYGSGRALRKGGTLWPIEDTRTYLQGDTYATILLDSHRQDTVAGIFLIAQSVEDRLTTWFGTESPELRTAFEHQILDITNALRVQLGHHPLAWDEKVATVARRHSEDMRNRKFMDHVNPDGQDPGDRLAAAGLGPYGGENIASGQRSPIQVVHAWFNSHTGHRDNLLGDYGWLGVGVAFNGTELFTGARANKEWNMYYTQNFYGTEREWTPEELAEKRRIKLARELTAQYPFAGKQFELYVRQSFPQPDGSEYKIYGVRNTSAVTLPPFSAIYVNAGTNLVAFKDDYANYRWGGKLVAANHTNQPKVFKAGEIDYDAARIYQDDWGTVGNPDGTTLKLTSTGPYVRLIVFDGDFDETKEYKAYMDQKKVILPGDWGTVPHK